MFLAPARSCPRCARAGYGRIVNIASGTPYKGVPFLLHYVTSKGAVIAMTRALAKELGARRHPRQHRRPRVHDVGRRARQPGAGRAAAGDLAQGAADPARPVTRRTSSAPSRSSARRTPTSSPASRSWSTGGVLQLMAPICRSSSSTAWPSCRRRRACSTTSTPTRRASTATVVRRGRRPPRLRADDRRHHLSFELVDEPAPGALMARELDLPRRRVPPALRPRRLPARAARRSCTRIRARASGCSCSARSASRPRARSTTTRPASRGSRPGPIPCYASTHAGRAERVRALHGAAARAAGHAVHPLRARRGPRAPEVAALHGLPRARSCESGA